MLTDSAEKIGFPTDVYNFQNVYDPDSKEWKREVPQPVAAVLFLYVIKNEQTETIKK